MSPTGSHKSAITSLVGQDGASSSSALRPSSSYHELHGVSGGGNSDSNKTQRHQPIDTLKRNVNSNPEGHSRMNVVLASSQQFEPWAPPAKSLVPPRRISPWSLCSDSESDDDSGSEPRVGGGDGGSPSSLVFVDCEPIRVEEGFDGNDVIEEVEVRDHLVRSCSSSS
ncbi:hypothetical protein L218DRAFT_296429 [Marasmius fiardii PR-910]|nr:hypothetical protein L218DRAFT_296429 [Marasmius fiardii PR-910]